MAGLPNITGKILTPTGWDDWGVEAQGAFAGDNSKTVRAGCGGSNAESRYYLDFSASRSSSIYGSSETVTPLSESCLTCIRY